MGSGKLFGTDGIRGKAGSQLSPELAFNAARAYCLVMDGKRAGGARNRPRIVVGRDPRLSSPMLASAVISGAANAGYDVLNLGIIPTPVVPFAIDHYKAQGGVMVTASHNPIEDNGLKFFAGDGFKIPGRVESRVENLISSKSAKVNHSGPYFGSVEHVAPGEEYLRHALGSISPRVRADHLAVVLDCAHGATCELAPQAFERAGFKVSTICSDFDGARINVRCGATDLRRLKREVRRTGAGLGLAFDGDGDRVLAVDESGSEVSGDIIIALFATLIRSYKSAGAAVMTQMTNMGVEEALSERGIKLIRTEVGDINVLNTMRRRKVDLGGEQSGHILMLNKSKAGDGILSGLQLATLLARSKRGLPELARQFPEYPQLLTNLTVGNKERCLADKRLAERISKVRNEYKDVRFYLRPSGTENVVRVLTESASRDRCRTANAAVCDLIRQWDNRG